MGRGRQLVQRFYRYSTMRLRMEVRAREMGLEFPIFSQSDSLVLRLLLTFRCSAVTTVNKRWVNINRRRKLNGVSRRQEISRVVESVKMKNVWTLSQISQVQQ